MNGSVSQSISLLSAYGSAKSVYGKEGIVYVNPNQQTFGNLWKHLQVFEQPFVQGISCDITNIKSRMPMAVRKETRSVLKRSKTTQAIEAIITTTRVRGVVVCRIMTCSLTSIMWITFNSQTARTNQLLLLSPERMTRF